MKELADRPLKCQVMNLDGTTSPSGGPVSQDCRDLAQKDDQIDRFVFEISPSGHGS